MAASTASPAVALTRRGLSFEVFEEAAFRLGMLERVERQVIFTGSPVPAIHRFAEDHEASLDWSQVDDPGVDVGATFRAVASDLDAVRTAIVAILDDGAGQSSVFVMEAAFDEGQLQRWWLAIRRFEVNRAGVGRLLGAWSESSGEEGLPPMPFARLVAPPPEARALRVLPPRRPAPDIRVAFGELPAPVPDIIELDRLAELATALFLPDVVREGIDHIKVLRLAGRAWEEWRLRGDLPAELDDMVRYIAQRGQAAEGVVVAQGILFVEEGEPTKALQLRCELGGERQERIFTFRFPDGPQSRQPSRGLRRDRGPVPEGEGWLGVDPGVSFELGPQGAEA